MRVLTGAISHETSTFTPVPTTEESFYERFGVRAGSEMLVAFEGSNTPLGGFIEGAAAHGFELVPALYAEAHPSGPAPRTVLDSILREFLTYFDEAGHIDGVLLEMHGSMVVEGLPDADGHILSVIRERVGPTVPVVVQLDIHSNISRRMVHEADV